MLRMTLVLKVVRKLIVCYKVIYFSIAYYFVWRQSTGARLYHNLLILNFFYSPYIFLVWLVFLWGHTCIFFLCFILLIFYVLVRTVLLVDQQTCALFSVVAGNNSVHSLDKCPFFLQLKHVISFFLSCLLVTFSSVTVAKSIPTLESLFPLLSFPP